MGNTIYDTLPQPDSDVLRPIQKGMCSYAESNYKAPTPPSPALAAAIQKHLEYLKGSLKVGVQVQSETRKPFKSILSEWLWSQSGSGLYLFFLIILAAERHSGGQQPGFIPQSWKPPVFPLNKDKCLYFWRDNHSRALCSRICSCGVFPCDQSAGDAVAHQCFTCLREPRCTCFDEVVSVFCLVLSSQRRLLHLIYL